jgi:hypothetical protein
VFTIDKNSACKHRWRVIGSHTLHVGNYIHFGKKLADAVEREVRMVKMCMEEGCKEIRVSIRHKVEYARGKNMQALRQQHKRIVGETAIKTFKRNRLLKSFVDGTNTSQGLDLFCFWLSRSVHGICPSEPINRQSAA